MLPYKRNFHCETNHAEGKFIDFKSAFETIRRADGYRTEWFEVLVGVRQGCLLSPTLLNVFLDFVMEDIRCLNKDLTFDGNLNMDLKYADDTTLIASVFDLLYISTAQQESACKMFGMKLNAAKSKLLTDDQRGICIDGVALEKVDSFFLLGSQISSNSNGVRRKDVGKDLRLRLFISLILPIAVYACETWSLTKEDIRNYIYLENL